MILPAESCGRGSSRKPRASGDDPTPLSSLVMEIWVNPARAGMILLRLLLPEAGASKPRASGDDPEIGDIVGQAEK